MHRLFCISCALGVAAASQAGLVYGEAAENQFAAWHAQHNEGFLNFEDKPSGFNLLPGADPFGLGVRFASVIYTNGTPFGPEHVEVSSRHHYATYGNTIVGSPFQFGSDDGRVGYQITFDTPQAHAGLRRIWNTEALTRFYDAAGNLLAEHVNTTSVEFVGYVAEASDGSDRVARILMDTTVVSGTRQVGYSDDLYFGLIPTPATSFLGLAGAAVLASRRRR